MKHRTIKRIRARGDFIQDRVRKTVYQRLRPAGMTTPIFIVGCQRSGTNMLVRVLNKPGSTWLYNEGTNAAFDKYRLRPDETISHLFTHSRAQHMLFKPLCDSQWTDRLLGLHPKAQAIWIYRDYGDVALSAVRHWGSHQREMMLCVAEGNPAGAGWQAERIQPHTSSLIQQTAHPDMSDLDGAVLKWLLRNQLFFDQQLDQHPRVLLLRYEDLVRRPDVLFARLFGQLGMTYQASYSHGIFADSVGRAKDISLQASIAQQAERLLARFRAVYEAQTLAHE